MSSAGHRVNDHGHGRRLAALSRCFAERPSRAGPGGAWRGGDWQQRPRFDFADRQYQCARCALRHSLAHLGLSSDGRGTGGILRPAVLFKWFICEQQQRQSLNKDQSLLPRALTVSAHPPPPILSCSPQKNSKTLYKCIYLCSSNSEVKGSKPRPELDLDQSVSRAAARAATPLTRAAASPGL